MSRITGSLASYIVGGASQQPSWLRHATQSSRVDNAWTSLAKGNSNRHPTDHKGVLFTDHGGESFTKELNISPTQRYIAIIGHEDVRLVNVNTGAMLPVYGVGGAAIGGSGPATMAYLKALNPDPYSLPNAETCASLDTGTGGWKGGTATPKSLTTAAAVGPYGGVREGTVAHTTWGSLSCTCNANVDGHWNAFTSSSGWDNRLVLGWQCFSFYVRNGTINPSTDIGATLYDSAGPWYLARGKWIFTAGALNTTGAIAANPDGIIATPTSATADVGAEFVGCDANDGRIYRVWINYYAVAGQENRVVNFGVFLDREAGGATPKNVLVYGLRVDKGRRNPDEFITPPRKAYDAVLVENQLIVINRLKTPAMGSTVSLAKTFGQILKLAGTPAASARWNLTINGVTKNFEFQSAALPPDADPVYYVLRTGALDVVADAFAKKVGEVYGKGIARSFGNAISLSYAAGSTITVSETADTGNMLSNVTADTQDFAWIDAMGSNQHLKIAFEQGTYKVRAATVSTASINLGLAPTGLGGAQCVDGDPATSANSANCAISNGNQGVRVTNTERMIGTDPTEGAGVLVGALETAMQLTTDPVMSGTITNGYVISGITGGVSWINTKNTIVDRDGVTLRVLSENDITGTNTVSGGDIFTYIPGSVSRESLLPPACLENTRLRVTRDKNNDADDYFVRAVTAQGYGFAKVADTGYIESTDYNVIVDYDNTSMPHRLIIAQDNSSGSITGTPYKEYGRWDYCPWDTRIVGDDTLNPVPSFIGNPIQAISVRGGRLELATAVHLCRSEVSSIFNFFLTSTRKQLDGDPIDRVLTAPTSTQDIRPANIHAMVPFSGASLLFTDGSLFTASGSKPEDTKLEALFEAEVIRYVKPVRSQTSVFFPIARAAFSGIDEIRPSAEGGRSTPYKISEHIPHYISGAVTQMAVSISQCALVVLADGDKRNAYVYQFSEPREDRLQEAWSKWTFGATGSRNRAVLCFESDLYFITQKNYGWFLEKMTLQPSMLESDGTWLCRLDRRVNENTPGFAKSYSAGPNQTTITIPYKIESGDTIEVWNRTTGVKATVASAAVSGTSVVVSGNFSTTNAWVGVSYTWAVELTPPMIRDTTGQGILANALEVKKAYIAYHDTGSFIVTVTHRGAPQNPSTFTAPSKDSALVALSAPYLDTGRFEVPAFGMSDALQIVLSSASALPVTISVIDFEAFLVAEKRG